METPLLLKIMLSWAIMIFCFTALFAGAHHPQESLNPNESEEEKEIINSKQSKELQSDLKKLKMEFQINKEKSENLNKKQQSLSGGSVLSATHRNKDSE